MATLYGSIGGTTITVKGAENRFQAIQEFLAKVTVHIPGEIITIYLIIQDRFDQSLWGIGAAICWFLAIVARFKGTQGEGKWINVGLTSLAFPIWIMAIGDTILGFTFGEPYSTALVLIFAVLAGLFYNNK